MATLVAGFNPNIYHKLVSLIASSHGQLFWTF